MWIRDTCLSRMKIAGLLKGSFHTSKTMRIMLSTPNCLGIWICCQMAQVSRSPLELCFLCRQINNLEGQKTKYVTKQKNHQTSDLWEAKWHYAMLAPSQPHGTCSREFGWLDWLPNLGAQNGDNITVVLPSLQCWGKREFLFVLPMRSCGIATISVLAIISQ